MFPTGQIQRVIGDYRGNNAGPMFICIAGLHGNEPGGVIAAQQVLRILNELQPAFCGDAVFLAGNLKALVVGQRYIDEDLNRGWTPDRIQNHKLLETVQSHLAEADEQRDLAEEIAVCFDKARGPIFFLDLHSVSSESQPFLWVGDQASSKTFAAGIPMPAVRVMGAGINGFLMDYAISLGATSLAIEGGQHHSEFTAVNHHNAIFCALVAAGNLSDENFPPVVSALRSLNEQKGAIPHDLEVFYRHALRAGDGFRMKPGFTNFQAVAKGELLAEDSTGSLFAPESGYIFMPLYQSQGDDGFFLVRRAE